jgi:4-amino-4-deoxy-L-arabinose transferase-like glycosyltransferase
VAPALLLIVVINGIAFLVFPKVGVAVGADTGTDGYKEIAENIVAGKGFIFSEGMRSTFMLGYMKREPIYPLFLSMILRLTSSLSPATLCLFQTSLSLISCFLVNRIGTKIFDASIGRIASYVYALHPLSFWYSTRFASEVLTIPIVLWCLFLIENCLAQPTRTKAAQVGLWVGIATLTRSGCVILLPIVICFAFVQWRSKLYQFKSYVLIMIFCYAGIHSLWLVRNYSIAGEIVPFTTMAGAQFFVGNELVEHFDVKRLVARGEPERTVGALYDSVQDELAVRVPQASLPRLEAQTDRQLIRMARSVVIDRPLFIVRKCLSGAYYIWFVSDTAAKSWGWLIIQLPLLAFAVIGIWRGRYLNSSKRFLLCVVVLYVAPYTLLNAYARYSMPIIPIVILFGSCGLLSAIEWSGWPNRVQDPRTT